MKPYLFLVTLGIVSIFSACKKSDIDIAVGVENEDLDSSNPQLVILVYDLSVSGDRYCFIDTGHIFELYDELSVRGGVVYSLAVLSNSTLQEPLKSKVLSPLILRPEDGNMIQNDNIRLENAAARKAWASQKEPFIKSLEPISVWSKTEGFSDIAGAMKIALQVCDNSKYQEYDISIVLVSDCLNDLPPRNGLDAMDPIEVPANVRLCVVRPANTVDVSTLFNGKVEVYATISDAIESI